MKKRNTWSMILDVCLPLLIYYLASNVVLYFLNEAVQLVIQRFIGIEYLYRNADRIRVIDNAIAMIAGMWFLRRHFIQEVCLNGEDVLIKPSALLKGYIRDSIRNLRKRCMEYIPVLILGVAASVTLNLLAQFLQVAMYSETFREVARVQYSVSFVTGLIVYGLISPVVEEAVFRGVLYLKCRRYLGIVPGMILSSLLFGLLHGNLIQGVYAFIMGMLICICYERYKSFFVPVLFHAAANIAAFTISYYDLITTNHTAVINCVIFAIISITTSIFIYKKKKS